MFLSVVFSNSTDLAIVIPNNTGRYPELVFISVVFSNSTNLPVMILNSSVLNIHFVK